MLELKNICKVYNPGTVSETRLFENFCLTVPKGEFLTVIGSNGSGKTSLINILCGTVAPDSGDVRIGGQSVCGQKEHRRCRRIGRVYQSPALGTCGDMTILENMALADNKGHVYNLSRALRRSRIDAYRDQLKTLGLGLEDKLHLRVDALSGGQRQALALLMATLAPLDFLLLDEHTAALDPHTAELVMRLTDQIIREKKLTAVMITHNMRYAASYGSRLIMLDRGRIALDCSGEEKKNITVEKILRVFSQAETAEA